MNTYQELTSDVRTERANLKKRQDAIDALPIEELEAAFPEGKFSHFIGTQFSFTLPMRFELIDQFKKYVANRSGWEANGDWQHVWNEKDAGFFLYLHTDKNQIINVDFRTNRVGAACVIQQIGFEQKPVFEVVCGEGASEPTFTEKAVKSL